MDRVAIVLGLLLVSACGGGDFPPTATEPDPPRVTSIDVSPSILAFAARGDQAQLSFVVRDQTGAVMAGVEVTWSSSDRLVASVTSEGLVEAVATGTVTATIAVEGRPLSVAFVPDGSIAYVANGGTGTVSVIDVTTGTVTATIVVGDAPESVAFASDGSVAYVANLGSDYVSVIDVAAGTVTSSIMASIWTHCCRSR